MGGTSVTIGINADQYIPLIDISDTIMQNLGNSGGIQGNIASLIVSLKIVYLRNGIPTDNILIPSITNSKIITTSSQFLARLVYDINDGIGNILPSIINVSTL